MLANLIFTLNIVTPFVILAAAGYVAKRMGLIGDAFLTGGNRVVFYLAIPAALFNSLYATDLGEAFDPAFMAFVAFWTIFSFVVIWIFAFLALRRRHHGVISAYVNGSHRGNLAMLAIPLLFSILGDDAAKTAMAAIIIIPIYNIQTLILLALHSSEQKKLRIGALLLGIAKNPPIIGTVLGMAASLAGITLPTIAAQSISSMAAMTMPLALICLGGAMTFKGFDAKFKFALHSALIKVAILPVVTTAAAWLLGFRGDDLTILMVIHGVPTAMAGYVMLVEIGGDTYVAGTNIMLTTILSAFTLSALIFAFRAVGIIA
ncbi:MAG: AEC family transporter [Clostridiales bacterium]|jgi:predicted permease|nr:AEC family transporter [Clostridiales bacterium]